MKRSTFLETLVAGSGLALLPIAGRCEVLTTGRNIALECLGARPGLRFLDGRTANASTRLVDRIRIKTYSGTRWRVYRNSDGTVALQCLGHVSGPRWLDGRTGDGTVGLAPSRGHPYTGTAWEVFEYPTTEGIVALKCLGAIEGNRWLDGRTLDGSVGLAPNTEPPYSGTKWRVSSYPICTDDPCD